MSPGSRDAQSPYCVEIEPGRAQLDASCRRSYAAMANHDSGGQPKAALIMVGELTPRSLVPLTSRSGGRLTEPRDARPGDPDTGYGEPGRCGIVGIASRGVRTAPDVLRHGSASRSGLGPRTVWLQAQRKINSGDEITLDYGTQAARILSIVHSTTPALC